MAVAKIVFLTSQESIICEECTFAANYFNINSASYGLLVFCSFEFWKQTILTLWIINYFSPGFLNSLSPTFYI